jgi:hypothetical protein
MTVHSDKTPSGLFVAVPLDDFVSFGDPEFPGPAEILATCLGVSHHYLDQPAVEKGFGKILTKADGFCEVFEGTVVIAHLAINNSPVIIGKEKSGVYFQGGFKITNNRIVSMLELGSGYLVPDLLIPFPYSDLVVIIIQGIDELDKVIT